jgi:hypothetical protein
MYLILKGNTCRATQSKVLFQHKVKKNSPEKKMKFKINSTERILVPENPKNDRYFLTLKVLF